MKRLFDIVVASVLIVVLSPLALLLLLLVAIKLGRPVLFTQQRPGLGGKLFTLRKIRSMTNETGLGGELLSDDVRLTSLGVWLRSTSLDELPGLWSVLMGDMSLVGPRPLLVEYLPLFDKEQARRHSVRPGLTGWAQVHGRNAVNWQRKFELDVWYVDHQSLLLDFKILVMTLFKVAKQEGISADGHVTMKRFTGND
jgi:lipopolysaccharide/colanic/teichoic acid biosynthesis glycosyltransferase